MPEVESIPEAKLWVGMGVHKDTVMIAVFRDAGQEPIQVQRLPNDHRKLQRFFERISRDGRIQACYEASGAGFVLYRAITEWGHACEVIASLSFRPVLESGASTIAETRSRSPGSTAPANSS